MRKTMALLLFALAASLSGAAGAQSSTQSSNSVLAEYIPASSGAGRTLYVEALVPNMNVTCAILFVHGFLQDRQAFDNQWQIWNPQCITARVDLYGHGKSRDFVFPDGANVTKEMYANDLKLVFDWLQARGARKVHLVGWSAGTWAVQLFHRLTGDSRMAMMTLIDGSNQFPDDACMDASAGNTVVTLAYSQPENKTLYKAFAGIVFSPMDPKAVPNGAYELSLGASVSVDPRVPSQMLNALYVGEVFSNFAGPVLLVRGEQDADFLPCALTQLEATYPNHLSYTVRGGSHAPFADSKAHIDEFNRVFGAFNQANAQLLAR